MDKDKQRMDELEERIKLLEQDVSLEQFCKGLSLLGHELMIRLNKAENDYSVNASKLTQDAKGENK